MQQKIVICGAGFLGSNIARAFANATTASASLNSLRRVQLSSRAPERIHSSLKALIPATQLLPPVPMDITKPATLSPAFQDASVVISLAGLMHGTPRDFDEIQWRGAENVARAARDAGAKLIHISAIGADVNSEIPYARTKALGETAVFDVCPDATVIRPSIMFGPQDDFFNRFSRLSRYLPFLPVFGGGVSRFQPVFVGDVARMVEIVARKDEDIAYSVAGKIIEAGGPDIFTYREIMSLVLQYSHRWRPIISLPFAVGMLQGTVLEKLPVNLFTLTRAQVEQLKSDNIVNTTPLDTHVSFQDLIEKYSSGSLTSVHAILPTYM